MFVDLVAGDGGGRPSGRLRSGVGVGGRLRAGRGAGAAASGAPGASRALPAADRRRGRPGQPSRALGGSTRRARRRPSLVGPPRRGPAARPAPRLRPGPRVRPRRVCPLPAARPSCVPGAGRARALGRPRRGRAWAGQAEARRRGRARAHTCAALLAGPAPPPLQCPRPGRRAPGGLVRRRREVRRLPACLARSPPCRALPPLVAPAGLRLRPVRAPRRGRVSALCPRGGAPAAARRRPGARGGLFPPWGSRTPARGGVPEASRRHVCEARTPPAGGRLEGKRDAGRAQAGPGSHRPARWPRGACGRPGGGLTPWGARPGAALRGRPRGFWGAAGRPGVVPVGHADSGQGTPA